MKLLFPSAVALMMLGGNMISGLAQQASLAPADMEFTRKIVEKYHFVAWVEIEMQEGQTTKYQYDHYPDDGPHQGIERIKTSDGVYVRAKDKGWVQSDDWGDTGKPVSDELAHDLDMDVKVVEVQLAEPQHQDSTQGGTVWKFVSQSTEKAFTFYTYERSREHPHPDGVYPHLTFMKAAGDTDGQLFLCKSTGNLRSGERTIPVTVRFDYLIPIAAGTKVEVFDKDTGKKKLQTVTGTDSGWEITTPSSAPPEPLAK